MIVITYKADAERHRMTIRGHAGYAEAGSDIVCAGVSSITCMLADFLWEKWHGARRDEAQILLDDGDVTFDIPRDGTTDQAFEMALGGYDLIKNNYPQYVEIL